MLPVVALVGRPNVGKSTLFNRITRSRDALVAEHAGLTRERQYGRAVHAGRRFIAIDTGGLSGDEQGIDAAMAAQSDLVEVLGRFDPKLVKMCPPGHRAED